MLIGDVLAEIRINRGWSQTELAENIEVSQASVCRRESKGFADALEKHLAALGISLTAAIIDAERKRLKRRKPKRKPGTPKTKKPPGKRRLEGGA